MTVRIEHDLLGDREIPAEVYWGIHTLRAIETLKFPHKNFRRTAICPQHGHG